MATSTALKSGQNCTSPSTKLGPQRTLTLCGTLRRRAHAPRSSSPRLRAQANSLAPLVPVSPPAERNPQTWRACDSFLPPLGSKLTTLHKIEDGLWVLRQDFFDGNPAANAYNNCFVVSLPGSGNMVISPISMTEEATYLLKQIPGIETGGIQHIVANSVSPEHWSHLPSLLKQYPDATVWACPGIDGASRLASNLGAKDLWMSILTDMKRSDGCAPLIRTIENSDFPYAPAELGGDVEFVVFASDPPLLQEATVFIKSRHAIVLGDLGFKQDDDVYKSIPGPAKLLNRAFKLQGSLAAPIPYPAMIKNPELGAAWKKKVMSWGVWDRLLCCHLQPVVPDGRAELQQCYAYLPRL